ncbi:carbohydrate ABC transporter permease [Paenibacillus aurantiacus]|uniref:Carbohydrate ABC transporter permease n=1 Tax=Paenibacillus aurantiacus TaxID=1936118 RepID=A0ABV5KUS5_9BACL
MLLRGLGGALVVAFALIIIVPLMIVLLASLKTSPQFIQDPLGLPDSFSLANYAALFAKQPMWTYFGNSVFVTLATVAGELLVAGMVAYGIIRTGRRTGGWMFGLFAAGLMVPTQVNMIPIYQLVHQLGWSNSLIGLSLVTIAMLLPLSVFMLGGFMRTLPGELFEAGAIDGASEWRLLTRIALPLAAPYFAATACFLFVIVWNDLLFPMLLLTGKDKLTLPLAMLQFRGEFVTDYPMLLTGVVVASIPIIVVFVLLQRFFISGALAGSMKG